jgi:hypothetical protein
MEPLRNGLQVSFGSWRWANHGFANQEDGKAGSSNHIFLAESLNSVPQFPNLQFQEDALSVMSFSADQILGFSFVLIVTEYFAARNLYIQKVPCAFRTSWNNPVHK